MILPSAWWITVVATANGGLVGGESGAGVGALSISVEFFISILVLFIDESMLGSPFDDCRPVEPVCH